ncbi:hypothetical protein CS022_03635 [Veronia nyctiphanis]|uniref:Uncharacterized protein n=1 Tax=Veronia nyctiphanis TaxID=1278244 RepID=A0A4Q0YUY8_9GAMM|nr:hypothetical protein [Veronia nyctiphanis]RXJ74655.1 hypothetical protein CS022_03635 [Veronia nyctiphanis]
MMLLSSPSFATCNSKLEYEGTLQNNTSFRENSWEKPLAGYFKVVSGTLMSNECGERYVQLTIKNTDSIRHVFEEKHITAVMADQSTRYPRSIREDVDAREEFIVIADFGSSQFPILAVVTRDERD